MMEPVHRVEARGADPARGRVRLDVPKCLWLGGHAVVVAWGVADPGVNLSWPLALVSLALLYLTLLFGHSLGLHRLLIHRTVEAGPRTRAVLMWLGVLVGMGGPSTVVRLHDTRDWAQRSPRAHPYFSHDCGYLRDVWWQMTSRFDFETRPRVGLTEGEARDPAIRHLDRWWRLHALAPALPLVAVFGWAGLVWGVSARILVSTLGHWSVVHACHAPHRARAPGSGRHDVRGAGVQASDLTHSRPLAWIAALLTHGECWHSHHHAFPESARIGYPGQPDPGFAALCVMQRLGLVRSLRPRRADAERDDLVLRRTDALSPRDQPFAVEPGAPLP